MSTQAIGVMFFSKHLKYFLELDNESAGKIIKAVVKFHCGKEINSDEFDLPEKMLFDSLVDDMQSSLGKYIEMCEKRREAGKKAANARWKKEKNTSENQSPAPWEKEEPKDIFPVPKEENEEIIPFENVLEKNIPDENVSENIQPAEKASEENIPEKTVPKADIQKETIREIITPDENISEKNISVPQFESIDDMFKMEKELF